MNQKIAFFIIVVAAILAIAGFLLVTLVLSPFGNGAATVPTAAPRENWLLEQRVVADTIVDVQYDPLKQVVLLQPPAPTDVLESELPPTEIPTALPTAEAGTGDGGQGQAGAGDGQGTTDQGQGATQLPGGAGQPGIVPSVSKVIFVPYTVGPNDTLFSVAQYHINRGQPTSVALMAKHGIDGTQIVAGNQLSVPVANPAYCMGSFQPYVVLEGDNAFRIALRFNTTPQKLRQINNLDANYTVYVTDVICVP